MILGDGTLHLILRISDKGSIWVIPTLFLPQLKNKYSVHFFSILEDFFKSSEIKVYIINNIIKIFYNIIYKKLNYINLEIIKILFLFFIIKKET